MLGLDVPQTLLARPRGNQ